MPEATDANAGYDGFLEAVDAGDGFYVECANGHGSLPPRRACPRCGSTELTETPLPRTGEVETYTVVHVPTPQLADDVPYVTAIARFGPARLSGFLRGVDDPADAVGTEVAASVGATETAGERVLVLRPA
ncbi:MAG: OB-fold domain-containing protein [Halobacteriales archaeon]|nr:OB-fold domain-containing protein [Halobacteriales archaeon]